MKYLVILVLTSVASFGGYCSYKAYCIKHKPAQMSIQPVVQQTTYEKLPSEIQNKIFIEALEELDEANRLKDIERKQLINRQRCDDEIEAMRKAYYKELGLPYVQPNKPLADK